MKEGIFMCVFVLIISAKNENTDGPSTTAKPISTKAPSSNVVTTATSQPLTTTRRPLLEGLRLPCSCAQGQCGCCTGVVLERFKQKACLNITYEPDEFAFVAAMSLNGRVLYKNSISGKNPPPICIRLPRFRFIELCVEFSNIYFANRNMHVCIDMEANWESLTLLDFSFDCIRMGINGVAVVAPEDGGGLPPSIIDEEEQTDEDYDDDARNVELLNGASENTAKNEGSNKVVSNETTSLKVPPAYLNETQADNSGTRTPSLGKTKNTNRNGVSVKRLVSGDFLIMFDKTIKPNVKDYS